MSADARDGVKALLRKRAEGQGADAAVARAQLAFFERLESMTSPFEAATSEFQAAGGIGPQSLDSREAIHERLEKARRLAEMAEDLDKAIDGLPRFIDAQLEKHNVPVAMRESARTDLLSGFRPALQHRLRETDRRCMAAIVDLLSLLENRFGAWQYSEAKNQVLFSDESDAAAYNAAFQSLQAAAAEQRAIQRAVFTGAPGPPPTQEAAKPVVTPH